MRIAIDIIGLVHRRAYHVALLFCQDQDLSEAADEIREIAREQGRWIAFPASPTYKIAGASTADSIPFRQGDVRRVP